MIKVTSIKTELGNKAQITAIADTKEEVGISPFVGLPFGISPSAGSVVLTVNGDVAFLKSNGYWNWVGEENIDWVILTKAEISFDRGDFFDFYITVPQYIRDGAYVEITHLTSDTEPYYSTEHIDLDDCEVDNTYGYRCGAAIHYYRPDNEVVPFEHEIFTIRVFDRHGNAIVFKDIDGTHDYTQNGYSVNAYNWIGDNLNNYDADTQELLLCYRDWWTCLSSALTGDTVEGTRYDLIDAVDPEDIHAVSVLTSSGKQTDIPPLAGNNIAISMAVIEGFCEARFALVAESPTSDISDITFNLNGEIIIPTLNEYGVIFIVVPEEGKDFDVVNSLEVSRDDKLVTRTFNILAYLYLLSTSSLPLARFGKSGYRWWQSAENYSGTAIRV